MPETLCDSCHETAQEVAGDSLETSQELTDLMSVVGADVEDHDCETWLHGGRSCPCACHPQTAAAAARERRRLGIPDVQGQHER